MIEGPVRIIRHDAEGGFLIYRKAYEDLDVRYVSFGMGYATAHPEEVTDEALERYLDEAHDQRQPKIHDVLLERLFDAEENWSMAYDSYGWKGMSHNG